MYQFQEYIKSLISDLKINKKKKVNYRNNTTVFTGILALALLFIIDILGGPVPAVDGSKLTSLFSAWLLGSILLFIPLGYFIPIIFLKVKKARFVAIVALPIVALNGLYSMVIFIDSLPINIIISIFLLRLFGGMLGSMLGYGILIIINRVSLRLTNNVHKMRWKQS